MLGPNDMGYFYDVDKSLIQTGGHRYVFCFALQFFSWWQRLKSLTEEKEVSNDGNSEHVAMREEKVFEVERKALLYTKAPSHYQWSLPSRRLNRKSFVEKRVSSAVGAIVLESD